MKEVIRGWSSPGALPDVVCPTQAEPQFQVGVKLIHAILLSLSLFLFPFSSWQPSPKKVEQKGPMLCYTLWFRRKILQRQKTSREEVSSRHGARDAAQKTEVKPNSYLLSIYQSPIRGVFLSATALPELKLKL